MKLIDNYRDYEPKTKLGRFLQVLFFNTVLKLIISVVATLIAGTICSIYDADGSTILISCGITLSPILIYGVVGIIYAWVVLPVSWLINKIKK